ncbi:MAG TPA: sulfur carrier protein ThiS adenylyltransferase ThiF [Salinivirgaceae bacterium]|nr:sulfur carrier protein ThiS adenylyltransferase ThiF [Salinivirgaceae bacterium]
MPSFNIIKRRLSSKKVGIAGSGGLGSNCAVALARVGVGHLVITDFDKVEESNLNRQYYFYDQIGMQKVDALEVNLLRINPLLQITKYDVKLTPSNIPEIFADCDVVVEAFDQASQKQMLIETILLHYPEKFLVAASGLAGWGGNEKIIQNTFGNFYICGDLETEVSDDLPPLAPRVGVVSNMQANIVLEILLGKIL